MKGSIWSPPSRDDVSEWPPQARSTGWAPPRRRPAGTGCCSAMPPFEQPSAWPRRASSVRPPRSASGFACGVAPHAGGVLESKGDAPMARGQACFKKPGPRLREPATQAPRAGDSGGTGGVRECQEKLIISFAAESILFLRSSIVLKQHQPTSAQPVRAQYGSNVVGQSIIILSMGCRLNH